MTNKLMTSVDLILSKNTLTNILTLILSIFNHDLNLIISLKNIIFFKNNEKSTKIASLEIKLRKTVKKTISILVELGKNLYYFSFSIV